LDALISAWRLLRTGTALALDRLAPPRRGRVPFNLSGLTPAWLTRALDALHPGVRVRSFAHLDQHSGTTTRARIALEYDAAGCGPAPPPTLFVKIAPRAPAQRLLVTLFGLGRNEVEFYRRIRPALPVRAPALHAAASSGDGRRFVLLIEDLAAAGARFAVVGDRVHLDLARLVVAELARLHAAFWESPRFTGDLAWVPSLENRGAQMPIERFLTGQMVRRAVRRFARDLPGDLARIAEFCVRRRDDIERLWARGPRTLVHGDCHVGNLFFEGEGVGFLDWQVVSRAPGMRDVSYFLSHSLPGDLRRSHERELLDLYRARLAAEGVAPPAAESSWEQYRLFALYAWIAAAFTSAAGSGLQAREIALAGLRRATRTVIDLESVQVAERLLGANAETAGSRQSRALRDGR
jgi:thiamine kinase-like enzyme